MKKQSGFTMLELIIVIAIIAVLSSMLFPVAGLFQKDSYRTTCGLNLRQLGIAAHQYYQFKEMSFRMEIAENQSRTLENRSLRPRYDYAHFPPPIEEPPKTPPPKATYSTAPHNIRPWMLRQPGDSVKDYFELAKDRNNFLGCPLAQTNPFWEFEPENYPKYHSYGVLEYNLKRKQVNWYEWIFSESDFDHIVNVTSLAYNRHNLYVNVYFKGGDVRAIPVDDVRFPPGSEE